MRERELYAHIRISNKNFATKLYTCVQVFSLFLIIIIIFIWNQTEKKKKEENTKHSYERLVLSLAFMKRFTVWWTITSMTSSLPPMIQSSSNNPKKILNQFASFALNSSVSVKIFCLCVFLGYLISFRTGTIQYLSVVPGKLLPPNFFIWTLATHSFIEIRLIELIADWFIILLYSKMIEPLWGVLECVQFYFLITVSHLLIYDFNLKKLKLLFKGSSRHIEFFILFCCIRAYIWRIFPV